MTLAESRQGEILREGVSFLALVAAALERLAERCRVASPAERRRLDWERDHLVDLYRSWSGDAREAGLGNREEDSFNLQLHEARGIV